MSNDKPSILQKVNAWVNERIPLNKFINESLHEQIIGGTRFSYTLGSACLFLLIIQIVTGLWHMFYYVPSVDYAYSSLSYLRFHVPYGWLVHGLHYWGAHAFTVVVGLHAIRVFLWASYKKPRELVWLSGVFLILMVVGFMFTGPVLAWDKKGYWAGQVGLGMAGTVPIVGPFMQNLLQGDSIMGQLALLRMFVLHVAIVPFLTVMFVMFHLLAFRQNLEAGPWDPNKRKTTGNFWPEMLFKDVVVSFGIFIILVWLCAFHTPEVTGQADPMDTLYVPKPEWNFYFLYEILKYFPGPWLPIGTVGIPTLIMLVMFSLPFMDKSPERNPFKRGFVVFTGAAFVTFVLVFTYLGAFSHKSGEEVIAVMDEENKPLHGKEIEHAIAHVNKQKDITGEKLYKTLGCAECHTINGQPSSRLGPDLLVSKSNNRDREWMITQIQYPQLHNQKTIMPPYAHLSETNINLLVDYLGQLTPPAKPAPASAPAGSDGSTPPTADAAAAAGQAGEDLFIAQGCAQCHTLKGRKTNKAGPDLVLTMMTEKRDKEWLHKQLVNPQAHNPTSIMPSYATRMNEGELNTMVEFLTSLITRPLPPPPTAAEAEEEAAGTENKTGIGEAAAIVGSRSHGAVLYQQSCIMCHGPQGKTNAKNMTPVAGVPSLNPIRAELFHEDPEKFAQKIDIYIQHGIPNSKGGPDMPAFGDTRALSQAQIADIEAYVMHINGVDRAKIMNPGMDPKEFFFLVVELALVLFLMAAAYWFIIKYLKF